MIVGGAALSLLRDAIPKDVDLASYNSVAEDIAFLVNELKVNKVLETQYSFTFACPGFPNIQLIKLYSGDPEVFLESYDLNICKIALFYEEEYFIAHKDIFTWDVLRSSDWIIQKDFSKSVAPFHKWLGKNWAARLFKYRFRYPELEVDKSSMEALAIFIAQSTCQDFKTPDCSLNIGEDSLHRAHVFISPQLWNDLVETFETEPDALDAAPAEEREYNFVFQTAQLETNPCSYRPEPAINNRELQEFYRR